MSQRQKVYLVTTRRQVNAARQCAMKDFREGGRVPRRNLINSANRFFRLRVQPKDRCGARNLKRQPTLLEIRVQLVAESRGLLFQCLMSFYSFNLLQRGQPGSHAHRARPQRSRLVNPAVVRNPLPTIFDPPRPSHTTTPSTP